MGYYTHYRLDVAMGDGTEGDWVPQCAHTVIPEAMYCHVCGKAIGDRSIFEVIGERIKDDQQFYAVREGVEPTKWYKHDKDMLGLSREFPGVLFMLHGEGEEGGDLWRTYYFDGRLQHEKAVISYAEYDPAKLKQLVMAKS